ncbi:TetR/AcrR family transcriptional regulator [Hydrocarboniphaga effusa]|jgi:TetR/AcrR family transcriptional repressor of mexJK operon|uniref:TetR/AcrR family transcriptional regulator n=1 Tax=Hydrocarboniphaga effusa TaxID=243629 RepID=UPI000A06F5F7|nr:TetR/AcrR family transcriptional regulator [Hydrocarboniphaga effusa]
MSRCPSPPSKPVTPEREAPSRGRPKDQDKRLAVLESAKTLFSRDGLESTSMEAIAKLAGVSKVTLYSHFVDKDELFREAVEQVCRAHTPDTHYEFAAGQNLRERFTMIAEGFFDLIIGEDSLQLTRLMASSPERHRKLSALFWQAGPEKTIALLAKMLVAATDSGELQVTNPAEAASQFFCLIKGPYHLQMLVGAIEAVPAAERRQHIDASVDVFLRAYSKAGGRR